MNHPLIQQSRFYDIKKMMNLNMPHELGCPKKLVDLEELFEKFCINSLVEKRSYF